MKEITHKIILDQSGRHVIGKVIDETDTSITLHNPVFLFMQTDDRGGIQVQSYPVLFFEFINKDARDKNNWTYSKSSIVVSDVELDERILTQYQNINNPVAAQQQIPSAPTNSPKVISIDDIV